MAGQGYYNSFNSFNYQQFGLIDPELDPFNDSMSSLFDYNGYQQDGFLPPFTPPPTGNFAGVAPTPPTSCKSPQCNKVASSSLALRANLYYQPRPTPTAHRLPLHHLPSAERPGPRRTLSLPGRTGRT